MAKISEKYHIKPQKFVFSHGVYFIKDVVLEHKNTDFEFKRDVVWQITNILFRGGEHAGYEINRQIEVMKVDFDRIEKELIN